VRGRRAPRVSAADVATRITALSAPDQALRSTVFYSGLRLGELRALRWQDVDLNGGTIHVQRGWDPVEGEIAPKSANGEQAVPIFEPLRHQLIAHGLRTGRRDGFVFGAGHVPFDPVCAANRARKAWARASLEHVGFHSGRHVAASLMLDAGIPLTEVSRFLGHSSITITVDRYGHLVTGVEARAAATFDNYLRRETR
jgi:integrase